MSAAAELLSAERILSNAGGIKKAMHDEERRRDGMNNQQAVSIVGATVSTSFKWPNQAGPTD